MAPHHVLLLGGSGNIARLMTPLLLQRSWTVTSIIRNPDQIPELQALSTPDLPGKLSVQVRSLEDVTQQSHAQSLIDEVSPDYIVWSAGAGGKGGADRTNQIDREAAIHFIRAACATATVKKFLMVSHLVSRERAPSWWTQDVWEAALAGIKKAIPVYFDAKLAADKVMYAECKARSAKDPAFAGINLRPGTLSHEPAGKVELGKTGKPSGKVSRASVAEVAALLLEKEGVKNCWLDLLDGEEEARGAVDRCVKEGVDCAVGEEYY